MFRIAGNTIDCAIVGFGKGSGVPSVSCSTDNKVGPVPSTYPVIVSDQVVSVGKLAKPRSTKPIWVKRQSKG